MFARRILCHSQIIPSYVPSIQKTLSISCLRTLYAGKVQWNKQSEGTDIPEKSQIPGTMSSRYEVFSEENAPVILDIVEERDKVMYEGEKDKGLDEFQGINLKRGLTGVFEIEELVSVLHQEKAKDLFVVKIPPEYRYADYMVIASGRSKKHSLAMAQFVRKIFKYKSYKTERIPMIEGKNSKDWIALDLGNIVLHLFCDSSRTVYDLETLWSIGKEFDSETNKKGISSEYILTDYANLLASLTPENPKV